MPNALFFDFETGGFKAETHAALELAARIVDTATGEIVGNSVHTLIKPIGIVSMEAVAVHGIDPVVAEAEGLHNDVVVQQVYDMVMEHKPVAVGGHNVNFDVKFMVAMIRRAASLSTEIRSGAWLPAKEICTLKMAKDLVKERKISPASNKLEKLAEHLGVALVDAHSAWNDINATIEVYRKLKALKA